MIVIQVLLGGITRLTESGLSITEWKPITGALPPLNEADWQTEFAKYRNTDQFKYVHQQFSMQDFKFIFFWEWAHRLWARLMGVLFIVGFTYFLVKKKFSRSMLVPMILLFILGALQGAVGWIMVQSGLVPEKFYVGHVELTVHFMAAMFLLAYTLWFMFSLMPVMKQKLFHPGLRNMLLAILLILFVQMIYGGFMAGLKAAISAPTWPDINGEVMPAAMFELSPKSLNLLNNNLAVHFIHRGLGYLLLLMIIVFYVKSRNISAPATFRKWRLAMLLLVLTQVVLGISTVLMATNKNWLVWLGVSHQFTAMILMVSIIVLLYIVRKKVPQG